MLRIATQKARISKRNRLETLQKQHNSYTKYRNIAELCLAESSAYDRIVSIWEKI